MFYVKLFSVCIKGKTHFLGIPPMVFGYRRSSGSQAGLAQRQLGGVESSCVDPTNSVCLIDAIEDSHR